MSIDCIKPRTHHIQYEVQCILEWIGIVSVLLYEKNRPVGRGLEHLLTQPINLWGRERVVGDTFKAVTSIGTEMEPRIIAALKEFLGEY